VYLFFLLKKRDFKVFSYKLCIFVLMYLSFLLKVFIHYYSYMIRIYAEDMQSIFLDINSVFINVRVCACAEVPVRTTRYSSVSRARLTFTCELRSLGSRWFRSTGILFIFLLYFRQKWKTKQFLCLLWQTYFDWVLSYYVKTQYIVKYTICKAKLKKYKIYFLWKTIQNLSFGLSFKA